MVESVSRFSNRVENYARYRPGYPPQIIAMLERECGLTRDSVIADLGSGTGILSELFLKHGNRVLGVEPGTEMRETAKLLLGAYPAFLSVAGSAEETTLESETVDFITAAQAFHWFDHERAKKEFVRISKPGGWTVLIWNERRLNSTPFLIEYEKLLLRLSTDYEKVRHENVTTVVPSFFSPAVPRRMTFDNLQEFDFEGLKGRVASASYTPEPGHPNYEPMMTELRAIFDRYAVAGKVAFEYDTRIYYGQLRQN